MSLLYSTQFGPGNWPRVGTLAYLNPRERATYNRNVAFMEYLQAISAQQFGHDSSTDLNGLLANNYWNTMLSLVQASPFHWENKHTNITTSHSLQSRWSHSKLHNRRLIDQHHDREAADIARAIAVAASTITVAGAGAGFGNDGNADDDDEEMTEIDASEYQAAYQANIAATLGTATNSRQRAETTENVDALEAVVDEHRKEKSAGNTNAIDVVIDYQREERAGDTGALRFVLGPDGGNARGPNILHVGDQSFQVHGASTSLEFDPSLAPGTYPEDMVLRLDFHLSRAANVELFNQIEAGGINPNSFPLILRSIFQGRP